MGSLLNDSPKQSFVFLDGVSASPGSVSCRSLYKREAPTLDSASLFIWRLVIPLCRIPDRTNELSNACRACIGQFISPIRSEEHTSELQSHLNLVCRLLLEK